MFGSVCPLALAALGLVAVAPSASAQPTHETPVAPNEVQLDEVVIGTSLTSVPVPAVIEPTTAKEIEKINTVSSADAFKYVPNLHVRKLQAGNINQPIALRGNTSTTAGPRTLVLVDGLQLTNYISGGMSDSPKWQMISAEEITRFDVIYGPFSASYGGNSFSGTVLITTKMPQQLELRAGATTLLQSFRAYATHVSLPGYHANASVGDRRGVFSYVLAFDRVHALDQPISFHNLGTAGAANANPVSGALSDTDATGKARTIIGSQGPMESRNNTLKLKLGCDITTWSELRLTFAFWDNQTDRKDPETYLRDAAGNKVFAGLIEVGGQGYTQADDTFTYQSTQKQELFYGLTYRVKHPSGLNAFAGISYYDTVKDRTQVSSTAPTAAKDGAAGTVTEKNSGSWVADGKVSYPLDLAGRHTFGTGYHFDRFDLRSEAWKASDWLADVRTSLTKLEQGKTQSQAAFLDDLWQIHPWWNIYLGGRLEWWKAFDGAKAIDGDTGRITTGLPTASNNSFSPKLATTFTPVEAWSVRLSYGVANRYPTVGELFYGGIGANGIISNGNPDLRRERNTAKDLTFAHALSDGGQARLSFFQDDVRDAILSQTNSYTSTTNYQNVDKVRTRGIELAVNLRNLPQPRLGLAGSLVLNDSEILGNGNVPLSVGKQFPRVPRWRAKLSLDYATQERWLFFVGGNYASRAHYTLDNSDTGGGYGAVDSYLVFDARVSFRINRILIANMGVDNLTNRLYYEFHPFPGRTFHLGVKAAY